MNSGLKFNNGLIVFAVVLICMVFIAAPAQYFLGIYGLAVTELMLLVIALVAARILKVNFRNTFPLKLPPIRYFIAALFLYAGMYLIIMLVLMTTEFFFPSMNDVGQAIISIGSSASPAVSLLIMAVLPAICEEILHRGLILSSFKHIKNTALIIIYSGVIFGLFHLDPYRFLSTALLGGTFAYITLKTNSMILPMLFHFITNAVSVYAIFSVSNMGTAISETAVSYTNVMLGGFWLVVGSIALPAIYIGIFIFKDMKPRKTTAVIISSFIMLIIGMILLIIGAKDTAYFGDILNKITDITSSVIF
ncbi:MAG: CPBP family intramembrane glutamic endopeptidase [Eubacteriales bacterium]